MSTNWEKFIKSVEQFLAYPLSVDKDHALSVGGVLLLIVTLFVTHFVLRLVRKVATKRLDEQDRYKFKTLFAFVKYFIFTVVIVITLESLGFKITVLLAGSTALFVGLGLGMQKLFQDIISGIFILIDRTITVNDVIEIDKKVGKVISINLRTTKAITNDDKILVIPNHKFLNEILYNWTQNYDKTREFVSVGVAYGTNVDLVKETLTKIALENERVLKNPKPDVFFQDFGDSSLDFRLYFFVADSFNVPKVKSEIRFGISKAFEEQNIAIPFPQRDIHIIEK